MDYSVDDQWVYHQISTHSFVELRSQECSAKPIGKKIGKGGSDLSEVGELAPSAASVRMKIMYAARMARYDLLRQVQCLATFMTKWTRQQDLELHRLVCYIDTTKKWKTVGWIGD